MQQATAPVQDMGQAMMSSLASALGVFMGVIPKLFAFAVILIIGWLIAAAVAGVVAGVLRGLRFNDLAQRSGFSASVQNTGARTDASGFIANIARWFIRLITLIVAFDALGLPAVSQVLQQMLLWLPNAAVALAILVIGGLAAGWLAGLVRGATASAELGNPDVLANITRGVVLAFTVLVAVNQLGVATDLVQTLFMGVVGALTLALGLAFGLGGRETAGEIVRGWYAEGQRVRQRRAGAPRAVAAKPRQVA
jgi:Conserved TM helix